MPMSDRLAARLVHAGHVSDEAWLFKIARGLVGEDPAIRARRADEVTDIIRDLSSADAAALAYLLGAVRISEFDVAAQEAQLHALAELSEWHELPAGALALLSHVPRETLSGSQSEYVDDLCRE